MKITDITKTKARFSSEDERANDAEKALKNRVLSLYEDGKEFDDICQSTYDKRLPISTSNFINQTKNSELKKLFDDSKNRYQIHVEKVGSIIELAIIEDAKK